MKRMLSIVFLIVALATITLPASAQSIGGVCISNTTTCGVYTQGKYLSIFGTNMPVSNQPGNTAVVVENSQCSGFYCSSIEVIRSSTGIQTWWYESPTQINFYALYITGAASNVYIQVCNQNTKVCTSASGALRFS